MNNNVPLANFCANIRYLRKSRGLTQKQMAQKLHVSIRCIRSIEGGHIPPRLGIGILYYLLKEFEISPEAIFSQSLDPGNAGGGVPYNIN